MVWRRVGAIAACAAAVAVASASYRGNASDPGIAELGPGAWAAATATAAEARLATDAIQPDGDVGGARSRPAAVPLITREPRRGGSSVDGAQRVGARRGDVSAALASTNTPAPAATAPAATAPTATAAAVSTSTPAPAPAPATATPAARLITPTTAPALPPTVGPPTVAPPPATSTAAAPTATTVSATSTPAPPPPTATPAATGLNSVDRIIATRGNNLLRHEINLPSMIAYWSWGQHGTEDSPSLPRGAGSVNAWLVVERDNSQLNTPLNVRVNVRNMRAYVYRASTRSWTLAYSGLPTWMVRTADPGTAGPYYDVAPRVEPDGSYSFDVPVGAALHMSSPAPGLRISESNGVLTTVEARVIGPDAAVAKIGMEAGADYRDASGSGGSIEQAGAGQFGLLTTYWRAFNMLSSTLTDAEVRANPPPVR